MKTIYIILIFLVVPLSFKAQKDTRQAFTDKLVLQLENEKLAMDFYAGMYDQWKLIAFKNLSKCEEMHMKVVTGLIHEFDENAVLPDKKPGSFIHEELNKSYADMMSAGKQSENNALTVAGGFEENYISKLEELEEYPEGQLNKECLDNLMNNSIDHLNLLVCHLRHRGIEYKPVKLSIVKYINCIGDQASALDDANYVSPFEKNKNNCPYLKDQRQ